MKKIKQLLSSLVLIISTTSVFGQDAATEWAGEDKYNVVIGVLSVIFVCIVVYLIVLDRKIAKLEKQKKQQDS